LSSPSSPEQSTSSVCRRSHSTPSSSSSHGRNLGHRSSHSNSRTPSQIEQSSRSSHAPRQRMASVSLHDRTSSPASRGSRSHSSSHSRSLSRTSNITDSVSASKTLLASVSLHDRTSPASRGSHSHSRSLSRTSNTADSVSASKTPLRSNVFINESIYDEESGTDLASPSAHASASPASQGENELVPGEINTNHGSISVSPEGHTQGTGALHQSDQRSNIPSVVSQTPEDHPASNRRSSQQTIASRTSSRLTKGSRKDRRMNL
jgi:hypothetical protein